MFIFDLQISIEYTLTVSYNYIYMIHSLTFSNIGSFANEAILDFTWNKKDSLDDTIATDLPSGINVSKIMTIVGPNASGKSNILRVLGFLKFWITEA